MRADLDLLTPVDGVAGLICRGFTMRQIGALLNLRARFQAPPDHMCGARSARPRRHRHAPVERRRWPTS